MTEATVFSLLTALLVLFVPAGLASTNEPVGLKVRPNSLAIHQPNRAFVDEAIGDDLFGFMCYTEVGLLISLPNNHIVEVHPGKMGSFADDTGKNLLRNEKPPQNHFANITPAGIVSDNWWQGFNSVVSISKDAKHCILLARGGNVPAIGASKIQLKGGVDVTYGADEKTAEAKNIAIDSKLEMPIGPFAVKLNKLSTTKEIRVTFGWKQAKAIKSVAFLTASGEAIRATTPATGGFGNPGGFRVGVGGFGGAAGGFGGSPPAPPFSNEYKQMHFDLTEPGDRCTVRVTYFDKLETVTVPVDVQVGVGF
jgi:hypothetical protein